MIRKLQRIRKVCRQVGVCLLGKGEVIGAIGYSSRRINVERLYGQKQQMTGMLGQQRTIYLFTSSSNPTQVPLIQQIQAKIYQILKKSKPSLFPVPTFKSPSTSEQQTFSVTRHSKFETLGFDSLDTMELIACMEESFGIELQDGEALAIDTVGKAIDVFYTKINARVINKIVERKGFEIK